MIMLMVTLSNNYDDDTAEWSPYGCDPHDLGGDDDDDG